MLGLEIQDRYGDLGNRSDAAEVEVHANPNAWFFTGTVASRLSANVCGDCGFVELFVDNPRELYQVYRKSQQGS
jgi:hypothetical protein